MNLPNRLSLLRVCMVPFFCRVCAGGGEMAQYVALGLFCAASLTDLLDGKIARARNLVTDFGKSSTRLRISCW